MTQPKILVFAGSLRTASYNKKLARLAAEAARAAGAEVTYVDLRELAMPIYDEDLETAQGLPEGAKRLKQMIREHHGLLIASPEYNSSMTAALKNALDWASRPEGEKENTADAFRGKFAALMAASPGALGGLRGLVHLRAMLGNIDVTVLPTQVTVSAAYDAFDEKDQLKDERKAKQITALAQGLVEFVRKHLA